MLELDLEKIRAEIKSRHRGLQKECSLLVGYKPETGEFSKRLNGKTPFTVDELPNLEKLAHKLGKPNSWLFKDLEIEEQKEATVHPCLNEEAAEKFKHLRHLIDHANDGEIKAMLSSLDYLQEQLKAIEEAKKGGAPPGTGIHRAGNDED